jgi:hypothetical protein
MKNDNPCPSCNHPSRFLAHGVIAPWLVELCKIEQNVTSLRRCTECHLDFFSYRYSEDELTDLYADYRSDYFFRLRHSWEPWYNASVNEAFSAQRSNDDQIIDRRNYTRRSLEQAGIVIEELTGCIDFGGDHGQFIPTGVKGSVFVVEKGSSKKQSETGITFVDSIEFIQEEVDLVLHCYVLEHLPTIDDVPHQMKRRLRVGGIMHFEVPLDKFAVSRVHRTSVYSRYLQYLARHKRLFSLVDFVTGVYRHFFGRIVWFGIVKQSEHINYFDQYSLTHFLESRGSNIVYVTSPDFKYKVGSVRQGRLACVAR